MSSTLRDRDPDEIRAATRIARAQWQETTPATGEPAYTLADIAANLGLEPWETAALIAGDVDPAAIPASGRALAAYRRQVMVALTEALTAQRVPRGQIASRLGVSPRTIDAYRYDPTNAKHREFRLLLRGTCRRCGRPTTYLRKGRSSALCASCRPTSAPSTWTRETAVQALREWEQTFGFRPTLQDLDRARAQARGPDAVARLDQVRVPSPRALRRLFGSGPAGLQEAFDDPADHHQPGGGDTD